MAVTLIGSALCNNALVPDGINYQTQGDLPDSEVPKAIGDPTEIALVVAADRLGLVKSELEALLPRQAEAPFDSDRKRMTTIHRIEQVGGQWKYDNPVSRLLPQLGSLPSAPYVAFTKGSVDGLLKICRQVWVDDRTEPLTPEWEQRICERNDQLANSGTRVLGMAFRPVETLPQPGSEAMIEQDLIFAGLVGMLDPARPEAKAAVRTCNQAGIRTVMITGDHPLMARHIAEELEISQNGRYLTGQDLDRLSLPELEQQVEAIAVYARVSPQQKLTIVEALKNRGHIVCMTGDGVNDAPALSKADIGVAMGITGTDVAKEAADMVLLNDNFATIVAAVEEGRVIYDNIRKFIRYSLTGNTSGVVIMLLAPLLAMPLPLKPTQILWINLLADGLLALALSVEPAESNVMRRPPYPPNESVFSRGVGRDIVWVGLLMGIVFLLTGDYLWSNGWDNWQTWVFATLAFSRMSLALAMRSERDFSLGKRFLGNPAMLAAVLLTLALQMAVIYVPWLQVVFDTSALSNQELLMSLAISTVGFWAVGFEKLFFRLRRQ
jgi:Ca2+-transporting ATPase